MRSFHDPFNLNDDACFAALVRELEQGDPEAILRNCVPAYQSLRLKSIRVVRYKAGRRCLIELTVQLNPASNRETTWIGKVRAKGVDRKTFEFNEQLDAHGFNGDAADGICVPRPIAVVDQWNMWIQEKVSGTTALDILAKQVDIRLARRLAGGLHKINRAVFVPSRVHRLEDELRILKLRLDDLAKRRPRWIRRLDRVFLKCERLAGSITEIANCCIHRDFHPDQILVDGTRLFLLDFDLHCAGDPSLDAGNFLGHLAEYAIRHPQSAKPLNDAALAFADQFMRNQGVSGPHVLVVYGLLSFARLMGLSDRYPDRMPFAEQMLDTCEECLTTKSPVVAVA